jgi:hypothetical protein
MKRVEYNAYSPLAETEVQNARFVDPEKIHHTGSFGFGRNFRLCLCWLYGSNARHWGPFHFKLGFKLINCVNGIQPGKYI